MQFDDPKDGYNPYAPPVADFGKGYEEPADELILAERGTRLGARILDGLLLFGTAIPGVIIAAMTVSSSFTRGRPTPGDIGMFVAVMTLFTIPLVLYQWYLLATTGQTLGKRWLGIKVVKMDGAPVDFVSGVFLRNWVPGMIGFVPTVGPIFGLVDILFIFGNERRCLHDMIAGTKVVIAPFSR
jgi:uncharacterized RDD family membrane protein YckC